MWICDNTFRLDLKAIFPNFILRCFLSFDLLQSNIMTLTTRTKICETIDDVISKSSFTEDNISLRQIKDDEGWEKIALKYPNLVSNHEMDCSLQTMMTPWYFGIMMLDTKNDTICGFVTFYVAYSSWNGKIMYLDQMQCLLTDDDTTIEESLLQMLAKIAVELDFARLTWRHLITPEWHSKGSNQPEMHKEVLTLTMEKEQMLSYVQTIFPESNDSQLLEGPFTKDNVNRTINNVLVEVNQAINKTGKFSLRLATEADIPTITRLIQGLADYVKEPDAVMLKDDDYKRDGFTDTVDPHYYCLLVDCIDEEQNEKQIYTCGFAFFFFGYELESGRFIYLEDLFIESDYRQNGGGSLVMATLAKITVALKGSNFYWQALDWNTAGLTFYEKIGAKILKGVKTSRYCADASDSLKKFARS